MINLLPGEYGANLRSAHLSSVAKRWVIGMAVATAGLLVLMASGYLYITQQSDSLDKNIAGAKAQLAQQNIEKVRKDTAAINGNIKLINQVLSQEIRFSDLIQEVGKVMPPGTVLGGLSLSETTGGIDLTAAGKDHTSLAQIAVNISDPKNNIFSKADIVSISCTNTSKVYPCTGTYRALFSTDTTSRFINVTKVSSP